MYVIDEIDALYHVIFKKDERTRHSLTTLTVVGESEKNIQSMLVKYKKYLFSKPGQRTTGQEDLRKKVKFVKWILKKTHNFNFRTLSDTSSSSDSDRSAEPPIEEEAIGAEPASPVIDDAARGAAAATLNGDDSDDPIAQLSLQVGF